MPTIKVGSATITLEGSTISSEGLKEVCPYCQQFDCYADCDGSQGDIDGLESEDQMHERQLFNTAIDVIEAMTLSLVLKKVIPFKDPRLVKIIQTVLDAIQNNVP